MKKKLEDSAEISSCSHKNVKQDGGYIVCQDCGLIIDNVINFYKKHSNEYIYSDSQREYERSIKIKNSKAIQDPSVKQQYDKIKTLKKWFKDYTTSFSEQKKTIELLKSYGIGLNINHAKFQNIKERYLRYNKNHRQTYQNMVIIFLAIVWMEIKDTTIVRIERFIEVCNELGHKINKKMLNNAMEKIIRTEKRLKKLNNQKEIEKKIKLQIKILFEKDLNGIPFEAVKEYFKNKEEYEQLKIEMQLLADKILKKISYDNIRNLNYKAFTTGLIYYIGQTLKNRKIFTQNLLEIYTKFSSTTIRKKFKILKSILGDPKDFSKSLTRLS
ncbi:MAG: hypothetical protein ACTSPD_19715 [Promethearchaeota archaeon]